MITYQVQYKHKDKNKWIVMVELDNLIEAIEKTEQVAAYWREHNKCKRVRLVEIIESTIFVPEMS